ncbi:uncharacterized protein LOC100118976 [Nasonia vitripennis]|uniref:H15 domain-containing protein n=1 Tax=Nasonia vitripennis TaxID=7425 RepID=A0A7M7G7S5_NASVI|nr:uncharacterized protein LOC100118976 [Nasonia vitripennis]
MSRAPRFEALVVNAIRRLQAAQGSTASEIASYLNQEYDVGGPEVRKQIQLTIRRGVNYGILQKSKRGYITCDRNIPEPLEPLDVSDCNTCRRSSRRSHRRGRSSRRGRKGKKSRSRRMGCRTCPGNRKRAHGSVRKARMGRQKKPKMASPEKAKVKKNPSSEESTASRQASRTRANSKSPMREDDDNQES